MKNKTGIQNPPLPGQSDYAISCCIISSVKELIEKNVKNGNAQIGHVIKCID